MSHQKHTTRQASISKKQRREQYALGCGLGLLPLLVGLVNVIFPCNSLTGYVYDAASFLYLGEILTAFVLLWSPGIRSIGWGVLTSGVLLFFVLPFVLAGSLCLRFVF